MAAKKKTAKRSKRVTTPAELAPVRKARRGKRVTKRGAGSKGKGALRREVAIAFKLGRALGKIEGSLS